MKKWFILFSLILISGCGYGMQYTKTIMPVPTNISHLKIMEIKDVMVMTKYGEEGGKATYIGSILLSELLNSKRFTVDEGSPYQLFVNIDEYRAGYRKYVALSAQILDTTTNKAIWSSAISGVSKKYIDEVCKNVVKELVRDMSEN